MSESVETIARCKINRIKTKLRDDKVDAALLRFELADLEAFFNKSGYSRLRELMTDASDICGPHVGFDLTPMAIEEINSIINKAEVLIDKGCSE